MELDNGILFSQKYVILWDHVRGLDRCETKVTQKQESFLAKMHTHTHTNLGWVMWINYASPKKILNLQK